MADGPKMIRYFTPEMVDTAMKIWMQSSVSLIDIRNRRIERSRPLENYLLPTSMFIYTHGAPASILLNQEPYQTGQYGLCHAGKGTLLSVVPMEADVETFMILYKADATPFYKRHLRSLMEVGNPFTQLYGFTPANPIFIMEKFHTMLQSWNKQESIDQFYAKVLLYQAVHSVYAELKKGDVRYMEPDYVEWVKEYLDKHYTEPLSIQELSNMLPMNRSVLARLFRKRENSSMQEYLIKRRIEAAKAYLLRTNASIQEIAYGSGFTDKFNMIRMFKRYLHVSPSEYRHKRSIDSINKVIDNNYQSLYNEEGLGDPVQSYRDGEFTMLGQIRSKSIVLSAALSLMLLISACGQAPPSQLESQGSAPPSSQTTQAGTKTGADAAAPQTRVVATLKGNIEIPIEPKRIIGIPIEYRELLHALGSTPIAAQNHNAEFPSYLGDAFKDVIKLGGGANLPFEAILDADPDLIIASSWAAAETFDALNKIAPTVVLEDTDWRTTLPMMAEVLNKQEEAQKLLDEYDAAVADARQRLHNIVGEGTVLMLQVNGKEFKAIGMKNGRADILYNQLGLKPPTGDLEEESQLVVSLEKLPEYDPDYILLQLFDDESDSRATFDELMNHPVFKNMKAFRNNHVFPIGYEDGGKDWHLFSFSPQGNLYGIQQIVNVFENGVN